MSLSKTSDYACFAILARCQNFLFSSSKQVLALGGAFYMQAKHLMIAKGEYE